MKKQTLLVVAALMSLTTGMRAVEPIRITTEPTDGCITLVGTAAADKAYILYDKDAAEVVNTAIALFISDVKAVASKTLAKRNAVDEGKTAIIVGTIGQSAFIDQLVAEGKLDVSAVRDQWEAYGMATVEAPMEGVPNALVVYGSQPRSTAYALLDISRLMGVSPWIWWADVTPARKSTLYASKGKTEVGSPSVKFRGIFINDEDWGWRVWGARKMDVGMNNVGPVTYDKTMELLLRLRANTLWPAMHACSRAFWYEKRNLPLITKYDMYMGSSHCEQMLRDNVYEWSKFGGGGESTWNWLTNRDMVERYWAERVGESRPYPAIYTLGMRGLHDSGMNGYTTTADRVKGLTEVLAYQRQLITDSLGDPTTVPQVFIPYKEVLDAYNAGLKVPDDVTLMWVDDNHGYIRQMPSTAEQKRSGGGGVYYHLSYLGTPASYLWLSTISPSLISFELSKAYDQNIRNQWIINVGDIKPAEEELEFCMDLAWDVNAWQPEHAHEYTRHWAARTFGEDYADEIAAIKEVYYRLGAACKPEHLNNAHFDYSFPQMDARIADYQEIYKRVDALRAKIPSLLRDAYFQLVEYPVKCCADQNIKILRAKQSLILARSGQRETALAYAKQVSPAFTEIKNLTTKYNTSIASGKWDGMMNYAPNGGSVFDLPTYATAASVAETVSEVQEPAIQIVAGGDFTSASESVKRMPGLGLAGASATVWPLDMKAYTNYRTAPYAEYTVHVEKGLNAIQVRCLPTFPLNTSFDLRVAISLDGKAAVARSIKVSAMTDPWDETVAQGYAPASLHYNSTEAKDISVRTYFMDPGLTVAAVASIPFSTGEEDLTDQLLTNADFEYNASNALNQQGTTTRDYPKGWRGNGTLKGNSWGVNQDMKRIYGINGMWVNSSPLPDTYELYQTIPASKLQPGTYKVTCWLGVFKEKMATVRLFANDQVQYYGQASDYKSSMLTAGETATYAGWGPSGSSRMTLQPMQVYVTVKEGESLKIGIRSSNHKADGTRSTGDNHGWFKVDHFRIQRVPTEGDAIQTVQQDAAALTGPVYDLSGRRMEQPTRRGIYVQRGKKFVK